MVTTSALCVYIVCISVTCKFQFLYSLISNCHTIRISYKGFLLIKKANYSSLELVLFKYCVILGYLLSDAHLKLEYNVISVTCVS